MDNRAFAELLKAHEVKDDGEKTKKQEIKPKKKQKAVDVSKLGQWEKHTKGFGMKMLQKMGFKGRLGRDEQGVAAPVAVKPRPIGLGLGYGDYKEVTKLNKHIEEDLHGLKSPERALQEIEDREIEQLWKITNTKKRKQRKYKTVEQLIEDVNPSREDEIIIDMRGTEVQYHKGMSNVEHNLDKVIKTPKFGQELCYNIRLIVDKSEMKIQELSGRITNCRQTVKNMEYDMSHISQSHKSISIRLKNTKELLKKIKDLKTFISQEKEVSITEIVEELSLLKQRYPKEYISYSLSNLVTALTIPLLKKSISEWDPLDGGENSKVYLQFKLVKEILISGIHLLDNDDEDIFKLHTKESDGERVFVDLVEKQLMPVVRSKLINEWLVRQPYACVILLTQLKQFISKDQLENTLNNIILPKLRREVDSWNPKNDQVHIHTWIHPWIPLCGEMLSSLYPKIRYSIGMLLPSWHPRDSSAHAVLLPWNNVWDPASMDILLSRCVVPKLRSCLRQELVINPTNQDVDPFLWVLEWTDLLRESRFLALMEEDFFPLWQDVLKKWLSNPNANYEEIMTWYLGWKSLFSKNLFETETIRGQFNKALHMMNDALGN